LNKDSGNNGNLRAKVLNSFGTLGNGGLNKEKEKEDEMRRENSMNEGDKEKGTSRGGGLFKKLTTATGNTLSGIGGIFSGASFGKKDESSESTFSALKEASVQPFEEEEQWCLISKALNQDQGYQMDYSTENRGTSDET